MTYGRIVLIPAIVVLMYLGDPNNPNGSGLWMGYAAFCLYVLAAVTDWLDGFLARKWGSVSEIGTFLDPIADKLLVAALIIALVDLGRIQGLWTIPAALILMREILVSGLREYLGPRQIKVPVTRLAKWKTTVQLIALSLLILPAGPVILTAGHIALALAAVLTVTTGWGYLKRGFEVMDRV